MWYMPLIALQTPPRPHNSLTCSLIANKTKINLNHNKSQVASFYSQRDKKYIKRDFRTSSSSKGFLVNFRGLQTFLEPRILVSRRE